MSGGRVGGEVEAKEEGKPEEEEGAEEETS